MNAILFLAHTDGQGALPKSALETLTAAREMADATGAQLHVGLFGAEVAEAANAVAGCGAAKFFGASDAALQMPRYTSDAAAAEAICKASGAELVLAPATSRVSRFLPGVAHRLGGAADTYCTAISVDDGAPVVTRWYYRQRMKAIVTREQKPWLVSIGGGCYAPYEGASGSAALEAVSLDLPASKTEAKTTEAPSSDTQTIRPESEILFVAGAGWTKKQAGETRVNEAESLILGFLDKTQSSLGSSKSLVDLSGEGQAVLNFLTHLHQVGQTGSTPRHPKGLATCCHGEEPHVVGWRFVNERRAINLDPGCGWAQGKADVLYVADAFEVMKELNKILAAEA
ncbi:MAG: electron transfer flavoprotein subunit alpha/FixB family protein [Oceanidesulfovibrio sp.]